MIRKWLRSQPRLRKHRALGDSALTLRDIGVSLAENFDIPRSHANEYLAETITILTDQLKKGRKVRINGLGIFQVKKRAAPQGAESCNWRVNQDQGQQAGGVRSIT
jgi:hypothetical protein